MSGGLRALVRASPRKSWLRFFWWHLLHKPCWLWYKIFYRFRAENRHLMPREGPTLIISNHESFHDPVIIGICTSPRPMYALARSSLYNNFFVGWIIRSLNGIPVDRGAADIASMRRCIEALQEGSSLSLFPEGTRTETGEVGPFKPGTMLLIKRAKPKVVPVAITGSFKAWPKGKKLPRLFGRIRARIGVPIDAETLLAMGNEAALEHVRQKIIAMKQEMEAGQASGKT